MITKQGDWYSHKKNNIINFKNLKINMLKIIKKLKEKIYKRRRTIKRDKTDLKRTE